MTSIWKDVLDSILSFACGPVEPHDPDIMHIGCIDAREKAGGNFAYADDAARVTEISAVIPPYGSAPTNIRAKFSFSALTDISRIKVVGHSFCGGAKIAIQNPDISCIRDENISNVVQHIETSGIDLPFLQQNFLSACQGNVDLAADLLSRHLALTSIANISQYPSVAQKVNDDSVVLVPLYHVMKEGQGESGHLEIFDALDHRWKVISPDVIRDFSKENCDVARSLEYRKVDCVNRNGKPISLKLPLHIAAHVVNHRDVYQPNAHRVFV